MAKKYEQISKSEFSRRMSVTPQNVTRWLNEGKLKGCMSLDNKKILWPKARDQVNSMLNPMMQKGINERHGKPPPDALIETPKTLPKKIKNPTPEQAKEISTAANLTGVLSIAEGQRIKTQYEAALKKLEYEIKKGKFIESDKIEQAAFKAGLQIREGLEAIVERCSPLLAGESDAFQCKEILFREINFILEGLNSALSVSE